MTTHTSLIVSPSPATSGAYGTSGTMSADGSKLAVCTGNDVYIYESTTVPPTLTATITNGTAGTSAGLKFNAAGTKLYVGNLTGDLIFGHSIRVFNYTSGSWTEGSSLYQYAPGNAAIDTTPDDKIVVSARKMVGNTGNSGAVQYYDAYAKSVVTYQNINGIVSKADCVVSVDDLEGVSSCAISQDGNTLYVGSERGGASESGIVRRFSAVTKSLGTVYPDVNATFSSNINSDSQSPLTGTALNGTAVSGGALVVDAANKGLMFTLPSNIGTGNWTISFEFNPDASNLEAYGCIIALGVQDAAGSLKIMRTINNFPVIYYHNGFGYVVLNTLNALTNAGSWNTLKICYTSGLLYVILNNSYNGGHLSAITLNIPSGLITIGQHPYAAGVNAFRGLYRNFRFFNHALDFSDLDQTPGTYGSLTSNGRVEWRSTTFTIAGLAANTKKGQSLATTSDPNILLVGCAGGNGSVEVHQISGNTTTVINTFTASDAASGDLYGSFIATNSDNSMYAIGAKAWEGTLTDQGAAYMYGAYVSPIKYNFCFFNIV